MTHQRNKAASAAPRIRELAARFPQAFTADKNAVHRPLAVGIREQLRARTGWGRRSVVNSMFFFCGRRRYQESLVEGAERVNLDGEVVGVVTADEAAHAAELVKADTARRAEKAKSSASLGDLKIAARARRAKTKNSS